MDFDPSWSVEGLERYHFGWERSVNSEERTAEEDELDGLGWQTYDSLVQATREVCRFTSPTLWLVDHRLRRKSTVPDENATEWVFGRYGSWQKEQLVFHADGCRYYAMPDNHAREFCGYDDAEDDVTGHDNDVFRFVRMLEWVGAEQEAVENRDDGERSDDETEYYATRPGILVCERD
ncbi:hypothetical protein CGCA056_v008321 [Colletotrichum aenigma]|uniref:uncharacterized protein n=1 Tax=Colletotrichum aenigma TaxID=1215731 RepID=UPI0018722316|nr:uncharacterized protein CGCA056_v008321 [Colletotrichum aenigma]KAF5519957.1 hypothetical protein CGCA056_v008321 [Colletotrichum aenigma]